MDKKLDPHIIKLALHLNEAFSQKESMRPVITEYPSLTVSEAYDVQLYNIKQQLNEGHTITGKKIGLTSGAMQELIGVDEPDYGHLLDTMEVYQSDPVISMNNVLQPRVEGELAFILKSDLRGPGVTTEDVLAATDKIVAAIEVIDSRVANWNISLRDTIADNGSSAFYTLGENEMLISDLNLLDVEMTLVKNGFVINQGKGCDVLGNPAYSVAWLVNKLSEFNIYIKAGEIILSGAFSEAVDAVAGDKFTCRFSNSLGEVHISFE